VGRAPPLAGLCGGDALLLSTRALLEAEAETLTSPLAVNPNCTALSLITSRFVNGNTVRNFPTHGQLSAAQGSPTNCL
jgi:hypothetical protein